MIEYNNVSIKIGQIYGVRDRILKYKITRIHNNMSFGVRIADDLSELNGIEESFAYINTNGLASTIFHLMKENDCVQDCCRPR